MGRDECRKEINPQSTKIPRAKKCTPKKIQEKEVIWFLAGGHKEMPSILALVYEPKCGGWGGCGFSANENSCAPHGAQINFGDLRTYPGVSLKEAASILDRSLLLRLRLVRFFRPAIS
jgi:hypothetical protein